MSKNIAWPGSGLQNHKDVDVNECGVAGTVMIEKNVCCHRDSTLFVVWNRIMNVILAIGE